MKVLTNEQLMIDVSEYKLEVAREFATINPSTGYAPTVAYVDGSLAARDAKILINDISIGTNLAQVDFTDASVTALDVLTQVHTAELLIHDASIGALQIQVVSSDASLNRQVPQLPFADASYNNGDYFVGPDDVSMYFKIGGKWLIIEASTLF
jgi:hypothetical protein